VWANCSSLLQFSSQLLLLVLVLVLLLLLLRWRCWCCWQLP
jgi:hypothetical protein